MDADANVDQFVNKDRESFAGISVRSRWPIILTSIIDDIHRTVSKLDDIKSAKAEEGSAIISRLARLKHGILRDYQIEPLADDGEADIGRYNAELSRRGPLTWFAAPFLFSECFMYRAAQTFFSTSTHWKGYDYFARQKSDAFRSSRAAVLELAQQYQKLIGSMTESRAGQSEQAERAVFEEMCQICLWGNATDLSILEDASEAVVAGLQGSAARSAALERVLVDRSPDAFAILRQAQKESKERRRVDFVLDNAGFELFSDLVLAGYLVESGLATDVVLHPKSFPWYVSDVTPTDFASFLALLADPTAHFDNLAKHEIDAIHFLYQHWARLHADGQLILRPHRFWTESGSFWRLPADAPDLYEDLQESELVIFKGDLNYRKLTADGLWESTKPFGSALGPLGPGSGVRVFTLRTCKCDVIVGLAEGLDEKLRAKHVLAGKEQHRTWAWDGKYAVLDFMDGKKE